MTGTIKLSHLLSRQIIGNWLSQFASLLDDFGLALFQTSGKLFAQAGDWDEATTSLLGSELSELREVLHGTLIAGCRVYPLSMGDQTAGFLVFNGQTDQAKTALEQSVLESLSLIINESAEKMSLADETLERYREVNLLYRLSETIGATLEAEVISELILNESVEMVRADMGAIVLFESIGWRRAATYGNDGINEIATHMVSHYYEATRSEIITDLPQSLSNLSAVMWSPLVVTGRILGGILLARRSGEEIFLSGEEKLLSALSSQAAIALNNAQLFEETRDYAQQLHELTAITKNISSSLDVDTVLERILISAIALLKTDTGSLIMVEGPERELVFRVVPEDAEGLLGKRLPAGTGVVGLTADTGQAQIVNAAKDEKTWYQGIDELTGKKTESLVAVPLMKDSDCLGVVELMNKQDGSLFGDQDVALLEIFASEAVIALENARLHQSELVKQRMEHELELGFEMQASLIPGTVPQLEGWEFAAFWQPAREVSGDFYDFIVLEQQIGIVMADVADKGVHAALFMALSRSIIRASLASLTNPSESLNRANRLISEDATGGMFVTVAYAQFAPDGLMTYVNAGHNSPLWYRKELDQFVGCDPTGIFMGYFDPTIPLEQVSVTFEPGDFIILFTDGVTEAMNSTGEEFGEDRLKEVLLQVRDSTAEEKRDAVLATLKDFVKDSKQSDDITFVIAHRLG